MSFLFCLFYFWGSFTVIFFETLEVVNEWRVSNWERLVGTVSKLRKAGGIKHILSFFFCLKGSIWTWFRILYYKCKKWAIKGRETLIEHIFLVFWDFFEKRLNLNDFWLRTAQFLVDLQLSITFQAFIGQIPLIWH